MFRLGEFDQSTSPGRHLKWLTMVLAASFHQLNKFGPKTDSRSNNVSVCRLIWLSRRDPAYDMQPDMRPADTPGILRTDVDGFAK